MKLTTVDTNVVVINLKYITLPKIVKRELETYELLHEEIEDGHFVIYTTTKPISKKIKNFLKTQNKLFYGIKSDIDIDGNLSDIISYYLE